MRGRYRRPLNEMIRWVLRLPLHLTGLGRQFERKKVVNKFCAAWIQFNKLKLVIELFFTKLNKGSTLLQV